MIVVRLQTQSDTLLTKRPHGYILLTFHVIQVSTGQHLGLSLISGHLLVDSRLQSSHAADADPLSQVIVAPLGTCHTMMDRLPAEPATGRG